MKCKYYYR